MNPRCKHGTDIYLYDCMDCEKESHLTELTLDSMQKAVLEAKYEGRPFHEIEYDGGQLIYCSPVNCENLKRRIVK